MSARRGFRGVLFDLDGTLLDTARDMAEALNRLRVTEGLEGLPYERIRPFVSHGAPRCGCVVAGDTLAGRKPHPLPLLHAAGLLGLEPRECVYVGDAKRDVQAARNAGMIPLVAGFGYLGDDEDPADWQAEAIFARPED